MRAAVLRALNEDLSIEEIKQPEAVSDSVVVELKYAALNHRDLWITKGQYAGIELPLVLGSDGVGQYKGERVIINPSLNWGDNNRFQATDYKILGLPDQGTFAEYITVSKSKLHSVPEHLSMEEAAALPLAGLTAYRALMTKCRPEKGEKVLISGIGGGVATMAFLFAQASGCEVYVTSGSLDKINAAKQMGAADGVSYRTENLAKSIKAMTGGGVDIVIDSAGGDGFGELIKACKPGGRIAIYGGTRGVISKISPQLIFWRQLEIHGSTMGTDEEFEAMLQMIDQHKIKPVVDRTFNLSDINQAFKHMSRSDQFGKIVVNCNA